MTKKKKKKESWKEKRQRAALKRQKALEAERLRREREPKKGKGWPRSKVLGISFLVVLVLVVGVYAAWQNTQSASNNRQPAPLFTLTDIDGNKVSLADFKGKVVIINFFDTYCTYCIPEILELAKIYEEYRNDPIIIISIDVDPNHDTVPILQQFREEYQINWIIAQDIWEDGPVTFRKYVMFLNIIKPGTPTTIIINPEGYISPHGPFIGLHPASTLSDEIDLLLGR